MYLGVDALAVVHREHRRTIAGRRIVCRCCVWHCHRNHNCHSHRLHPPSLHIAPVPVLAIRVAVELLALPIGLSLELWSPATNIIFKFQSNWETNTVQLRHRAHHFWFTLNDVLVVVFTLVTRRFVRVLTGLMFVLQQFDAQFEAYIFGKDVTPSDHSR